MDKATQVGCGDGKDLHDYVWSGSNIKGEDLELTMGAPSCEMDELPMCRVDVDMEVGSLHTKNCESGPAGEG